MTREFIEEINDDYLIHYGVGPDDNPPGRGSGRFPQGFGENPFQHDSGLSGRIKELKDQGFSEKERALALGYKSTADLRAAIAIEKDRREKNLSMSVPKYKKSGLSNAEIASKLGVSETTVRNYLNENRKIQFNKTNNIANMLKEELKTKHYIDVGTGSELEAGCSPEKMKTAISMLEAEGYRTHYVKVEQLGNPGKFTTVKVLGEPDTEWKTVNNDPSLIKPITSYVTDNGAGIQGLKPVKSIDSSRIYINYTDANGNGGAEKDGIIELRRGVEDLSLGNNRYSQVRIGVDGTHYMKGMALYSNNIPDGYDVVYNTNKKAGTDKYDVFKEMKTTEDKNGNTVIDQANPFGAAIKTNKYDKEGHITAGGQSEYIDKNGERQLSVINKVNEQGDWGEWSKTLSAQVLAKQPLPLVKRQLELSYQDKKTEFDEINALTNPTIKKKLMESFADDCDASAVHLKARAFPGQASHVIIPVPSLKGDGNSGNEIYAPNYEHGTDVALIRFPHAGTFEIPICKVNNHNKEAIEAIGKNSPDAVCINSHVAERLSGADFDGDTVVVIPITHTNIKSTPRLKDLEGFDPKSYKFADPNAPGMTSQNKQTEMGKVTNLIADMQIKDAKPEEVARAVKHSMVVIDAEKHHLDYKKSEIDNGIQALKNKYQDGGGSTTLITRSKSETHPNQKKPASVAVDPDTGKSIIITKEDRKNGYVISPDTGAKLDLKKVRTQYGIDPTTGKKVFIETGETYMKKDPTKKDPDRMKEVRRTETSTQMADTDDARTLMSSRSNPHPVELAYANYANRLKDLANKARLVSINTEGLKRDPKAAKEYAEEVKTLDRDLNIALKNAPRERQAQVIATVRYKAKLETNPELKGDKDKLKRLRGQLLTQAREEVGASKQRIKITDRQWEAIQKGAISDTKLKKILDNTDADELRQRATPRNNKTVTESRKALARQMASQGFTNAEIAERLGVSTSTVSNIINE